ncbi:hypothetical protein ACJX0J_008789, partial [Zea mays]
DTTICNSAPVPPHVPLPRKSAHYCSILSIEDTLAVDLDHVLDGHISRKDVGMFSKPKFEHVYLRDNKSKHNTV